MLKRYMLMIPGPVEASPQVLAEMGAPVVAHYGEEWVEVYNQTLDLLKPVFRTQDDTMIMVGSGTAGLDASIGSLLAPGDKALVPVTSVFSERMLQIARSYEIDTIPLESDWLQPASLELLEKALQKEKDARAILAVHHETGTGVLNPVREMAQLARDHGVPLVVDAISSLAGVPLEVDEWGIDICVAGSQKCLEAPPGLAVLSISPRAWELIERRGPLGHGFYLSLLKWREYAQQWPDWHPFPVTMATNSILALRASLKLILDEGLERRFERFRLAAHVIREGLRNIGMEPILSGDHACPLVTAVRTPQGVVPQDLIQSLKADFGIAISRGIGPLVEEAVRIGHMGRSANRDHVVPTLSAIEEVLRRSGLDIPAGASLIATSELH
jgi:alanine-glyoxylate transaminase/serine-glyoxylate transaminase/serine-pyruvate transaminase